jgi:glycosyltransferase involved in cell wall biosynthesis
MAKIAYFVADGPNEYNSSRWRVSTQYNAIKMLNNGIDDARILSSRLWMDPNDYAKATCHWSDLIVVQRVAIEKSIPAIKFWRQQGKAVVIDFDDDYFRINRGNAAYKFWGNGMIDVVASDGVTFESQMEVHPLTQFIQGLKACTAATMPSELLALDTQRYANAFFIPNYLEKIIYPKINRKPFDWNKIVIGWGGSLSHIESFEHSGVADALRNILAKYLNVHLMIVGDQRVVNKLAENGIPKERIIYRPYVPYDRWYETLLEYDIGIAPLAQEYDMRRSWIKAAEYMSLGIPFVATDTAPYQNTRIRHSTRTGRFIYQGPLASDPNPGEWESALTAAILNLKELKAKAQEDAKRHYEEFDIMNNIDSVLDTYREIIRLEKER